MLGIGIPGDDRPGLRDRINPAFVVGGGTKTGTIIIVGSQIPFSIPAVFFKRLVDIDPLRAIFTRAPGVPHQFTDICKFIERRGEEPAQPDAFASPQMADAAHAIIPVMSAHQGNAMGSHCYPFGNRAAAMLIQRLSLALREVPVSFMLTR